MISDDELSALEGRLNASPFPLDPAKKQFKNAVKREHDKAFIEGSRAKPPSDKQIGYLRYLLNYEPGTGGLEAFVRFANGYYQERITAVHYMQAIQLAKTGRNWYGTAESLIALASDCPVAPKGGM